MNKSKLIVIGVLACLALVAAVSVYAASTSTVGSTFKLVINAGNSLAVDVKDSSRNSVSSTVQFSTTTESASCQYATGTLGTNSQRIYVTSLHGFTTSWSLTIGATAGTSSSWSTGTLAFNFNDPTGSGCTNGQLTMDPSVGTITTDYTASGATSTGISLGSSNQTFTTTSNSITLMSAVSTTPKTGRWYLTGVSSTQAIPGFTLADTYTLPMTLTLVGT